MISRRAFVGSLTGGLLTASLVAEAQRATPRYRIGVLLAFPATAVAPHIEALREGLRELGYLEQQNLVLEVRGVTTAQGLAGLDRLADDLVRSKVDVLVASSTPATLAAKRATSTIPIVMIAVGDPVGYGLVTSLARPGGNVTGVGNVARDLTGKQMQLLKEVRPDATRIAVLRNPASPVSAPLWREAQAAGESLSVQLQHVEVREPRELESAFAAMKRNRAAGIVILADPLFLGERRRLAELARQAGLPTVFQRNENVEAGGLMSYGPKLTEQFRQAAVYIDKILKGAKPADLPVEQPTKFELVINLKTAQALGITMLPTLLFQADEVIR